MEGLTQRENIKMMATHPVMEFVKRQHGQIREGGWPVFRRKLRSLGRKLLEVLVLPLALLAILVIRLIRPWVVVRLAIVESHRFGHFLLEPENYLCRLKEGINTPDKPFIDLLCHTYPISNRQLQHMWERVLIFMPSWLIEPLYRTNRFIPGYEFHQIKVHRDINGLRLFERYPPHLVFLPEEDTRGKDGLRAIGIPDTARFVCLNVRDSAYLNQALPGYDWSYHDYRDSSIQSYILAAQELVKRGYYVVRMGAAVKHAMKASHPMIIDYATNGMRSDFMDIFLCAKCEFFISTGTGLDSAADVFRRPYMFVNYLPMEEIHFWRKDHVFVPKKLFLRAEERFMAFPEVFRSGTGRFTLGSQYEAMGIEPVENTPEEIAAVVLEMEGRLNGTWQTTEEDEILQRRFWEIFPKGELHGEIKCRIGAQFLRQNKAWLE